ncbi:MAG: M20/M25/M40 family metallo-hydrolase [Gemmatimonadaceae bacterium]
MVRHALVPLALIACVGGTAVAQQRPAAPARPAAAAQPMTTAERYDHARYGWEVGAYDSVLVQLQRILHSSDGDAYHDRIAELTGEIWQTVEVAKDARAPIWSNDGRHLAYLTGTGAAQRVHVVRAEAGFRAVAGGEGGEPSFAPDGRSIAWQRSGPGGRPILHWVSLDGAAPQEIALDAAAAAGLTLFGRAPLRAAVIVGTAGDSTATLLVRDLTGQDGTWRRVAVSGAQPVDLVRSPDGSRLVVLVGERGAFARPTPGAGFRARTTAFAELGGAGLGAPIAGVSPTFSRDGRTLAWIEPAGATARYRVRRGDGEVTTAAAPDRPAQSLAVSPDGRTIAFSQMLREDWEIFTAPADGGAAPTRITREIQHDLFPQFLANDRLLAVIGEERHRRSHLYDLSSGTQTRLFHNNTVRTVAPEYEWAASPDGSRVAVVAERDGDTVTPHRHLWLMDLGAKVTRELLHERLATNLAAEQRLGVNGRAMFTRIAPQVRAAVDEVSTARIYDYQKALFAFDSKHITQPGNWKATEWLLEKYRSFGLDTHLQRFTTVQERELAVANVVAVVKGTVDPHLVYVVGAHFDSRAEGPGADDNTSGTAMILEAARVIARHPQPATVMFVSFTGEESGLRGAREFGRRMKDSIQVIGALNNDMMGWSNDHRMDNTIRYSNAGLRDVQHAAALQFSRLITYDAYYYKSTDAHALYDAWGDIVAGIGSYPILGNPHYHMPHDVLETINHQQLAETSKMTVATIMLMASSPSRLTGLSAQGKIATWNAAVETGAGQYLIRYGPPTDPMQHTLTVTAPRATINALAPGWHVAVKAVNARGLQGWDWARTVVR